MMEITAKMLLFYVESLSLQYQVENHHLWKSSQKGKVSVQAFRDEERNAQCLHDPVPPYKRSKR